ncbi:MAG: response regulator, partial [Pyrinomonadaceae bacterium]
GLGLSIVRHIVELHGGHVSAESAGPGRGTTFTARLPAAELRIGTSELRIEESASSVTKGGQRNVGPTSAQSAILRDVRALVVEDDEDTRQLLRLVLERHGADVLTAASAAEALDALRRSPPDVFISDIGMPREDGYALIRQVRALAPEQGGHVPAIALTAYARDEDRDRAIALGYDVHIPKPVDPETLVAVVARFAAVEDNGDNTPPPEQLATAGT